MMEKKNIFYIFVAVINIVVSLFIIFSGHEVIVGDQCLIGGSCFDVQNSTYGFIFGIPVVYIGLVGFVLILGFSFIKKYEKILNLLILIGGIVATWLISVQIFILKQICKYCVVVDSLMVIALITMLYFYYKKNGLKIKL